MHEVSESPEEWQGDNLDEDPLPTVHRRVMLTDLPPSGLADIARRLKLSLPDPEPGPALQTPPDPEPEPESDREPALRTEPESELGPVLLTEPESDPEPVLRAEAEPDLEPVFRIESEPPPVPAPALRTQPEPPPEPERETAQLSEAEPAPAVARGPALGALPPAELDQLAGALFARVVDGPAEAWRRPAAAELPATEELYDHLCRADVRRIDGFVYRVDDSRPVVIVRPSTAPEEARTLHRVVGTTARAVDVWIGVPISMVLNPPAELLEAVYYATDAN